MKKRQRKWLYQAHLSSANQITPSSVRLLKENHTVDGISYQLHLTDCNSLIILHNDKKDIDELIHKIAQLQNSCKQMIAILKAEKKLNL